MKETFLFSLPSSHPCGIYNQLFALNNQTLSGIMPEKGNLLKVLKAAFSIKDNEQIIQTKLQELLRKMILKNLLPYNLRLFQENLTLFKDYIQKPNFAIFDKVNLELFSLNYEVKVVVYWFSEDLSMNTLIYNRKFTKIIEIFRYKEGIYDLILPTQTLNVQKICNEIVHEAIEKSMTLKMRVPHKRSFSEICLINEEDQQLIYNPFKGLNPPDDFFKLAKEAKKTPNISNFSSFDQYSSESLHPFSESLSPSNGNPGNPILPLNEKSSKKKKSENRQKQQKKYTGQLKFFDEGKNYGFFIIDEDQSDIFVHYDDLAKAKVTKEILSQIKYSKMFVKFAFNSITYIGKYNKSRKAIDIELLNFFPEFGS